MPTIDELRQILERIDHRSYNAYHEIRSEFALDAFTLFVGVDTTASRPCSMQSSAPSTRISRATGESG